MAREVIVELDKRSYAVRIGCNIKPVSLNVEKKLSSVLIVSDSNVDALYGDSAEQYFKNCGLKVARCVVPAGESSKSLAVLESVYHSAIKAGLDRSSVIIALGGGVVGDLAGFAAATYLRGVGFIQMPTTLLAMVDSSVGGKTGINLAEGKNLVGSFYQPLEVCADLNTLSTLPEREYVSGLAEVIKYGIIKDEAFFRFLENNTEKIIGRKVEILEQIVARSCGIKAEIVSMDERESGLRSILNFGHTLGHAIEQVSGYGAFLHGEAVAIGMAFASDLSREIAGLPSSDHERIIALLQKIGLPVSLPRSMKMDWNAVRKAIAADKKTVFSKPKFVLAKSIGNTVFGVEAEDRLLEKTFERLVV